MKIYCCYTPAHEVLFQRYFRPSLPREFSLEAIPLAIDGQGDYFSAEFLRCIREKIGLIRESIAANAGSVIVWSDVDIIFRGDVVGAIREAYDSEKGACLLLQREARHLPDINTGFMAMACGEETADFFRRMEERLAAEVGKNEQAVANDMLIHDRDPIRWGYLPWSFYARTHGWPPPREVRLYHANYTKGPDGVGQKITQFEEFAWIERYGAPARLFSILRRVPGKLGRIVTGRRG